MKRYPRTLSGRRSHPSPLPAGAPGGDPGKSGPSGGKRLTFTVLVILFPLLVLALLEAGLRIFSYDGNLNLIIERSLRGKRFYAVNRAVGRKYFTDAAIIPEATEDLFSRAKGPHTRRVFCIGESTMQGFPYEFSPTPVSFLRDRLQSLLPEDTVEVINLGLSAVGSYIVRDFLDELLDYEPDLFVVYVGHNEFYGAYGPGSADAGRGRPWMVRLNLRLLRFKTYLLLRDFYRWTAARLGGGPSAPHDATLMQAVVGNSAIPLGSETYRMGLRIFKENLAGLIRAAQERGVPILVSTLVSNLADQPPFVSLPAVQATSEEEGRWRDAMAAGDSATASGRGLAAAEAYQRAVRIDSMQALAHFRLGKALAAEGAFAEARVAFRRAKDLDALRFRATEEFQDTLLSVCRANGVAVARADSAFEANSPHGIPDRSLLLEHLHPNIRGYFLLGKVWAEAVKANRLLEKQGMRRGSFLSDSAYLALSAVSAFDEAEGRVRVSQLTKRWPFRQVPDTSPFVPEDSVTALVYRSLQRGVAWSEIRYQLADYYDRHGQPVLARRECRAVARAIPFSFQPLLRIGDSYAGEGLVDSAAGAYRQCIAVEQNPYAHMKLGFLFMQGGGYPQAVQEFEEGFAVDREQGGRLGVEGQATGRYLLGVALANSGRTAEARENLSRAIAIEPSLEEARKVLEQLNRQ